MSAFLRKYGTGTGADVIIPMIKRSAVDFAVTGDWTPATGDVKVSIDGGTPANISTLPVINGTYGWKFVFADAELQGKAIRVTVVDSATKAVEDQMFIIETYGHASAMYKPDFSDSVRLGLTALPNAAADAAGGLPVSDAGGLDLDGEFSNLAAEHNTTQSAIAALNDLSDVDVWSYATRVLTANTNLNDPTAAAIADAVWDEATAGHVTAGTFGKLAADVLADTNELQGDWTNGGRLDNLVDSIISDIAAVDSALAVVDGNVDSILLDTGTDGVVVASIGASALDAIHDEPVTEPSGRPAWASMTHRKIMQTLGVLMLNEINSDNDSVDVRNDADDANLWSYASSDDGSIYTSGEAV